MGGSGFSARPSAVDASVNHSRPHADGGMVEARFVQRVPERFIVYVSSMTGCDKACRFCHLTQTGQVTSTLLGRDEMAAQAREVLSSAAARQAGLNASTVHFNFMARGEPMSNPAVDASLFSDLKDLAVARGLKPRVKVSTIMPQDMDLAMLDRLCDADSPPVDLYYSLYSLDAAWRRRWVPKAMDPLTAMRALAAWRAATGNRVVLHWALVAGGNDQPQEAVRIGLAARAAGLDFDFNLVRYNPANGKSAEAPRDRLDAYLAAMRGVLGGRGRVREIPRVGFDVAASCGMFLEPEAA